MTGVKSEKRKQSRIVRWMGNSMLHAWTEILPLFIVRWMALRYCERVPMKRENNERTVVTARPDVYIKVKQ